MGGTCCDVGLGSTKQAKSGGIKHSNRRFQIIVITLASAEAGEQQRVRGIHSPGYHEPKCPQSRYHVGMQVQRDQIVPGGSRGRCRGGHRALREQAALPGKSR